ncbi:50S ribosomal protein L17 [Thermodesulfobacteriota bacterium]
MRHRKAGVKLNRTSSHRKAMLRNMVTSLFKHKRIRTTDAKAKELRRWADSLITLAKRGDLHARRQALSIIREKDVVHKLFEEAPERYGPVSGGYTRIVKLGRRPGDAAPVSLIELLTPEKETKKKKRKKKAATAVETKPVAEKKEAAKEKAAEEKVTAADNKAPEKKKAVAEKKAAPKKKATTKKKEVEEKKG